MPTGTRLDHVAIAAERWTDLYPRFAVALGGRWSSGGHGVGFAPAQLSYANDMRVELLQPWAVERNDFLRRFLDRSGPGPHHLTFKVPDIHAAMAAAEAAGFPPVSVDLSDPTWLECFLHPKSSTGVVVQLAWARESWSSPPLDGFPADGERAAPASLVHVAHAVSDLEPALTLFAGVLAGEVTGRGSDEGARWADLAWPGPGRLRLLQPTSDRAPLAAWIGDRPGRVHHVAFAGADPTRFPDALPLSGGDLEVPPDGSTGTRLVLRRSTTV